MKGNTTGFILLGLTLVSAVATAVMCTLTISATNVQLSRQAQANQAQRFMQSTAALVNDAIAYSKKNPAILPLLEQSGFKPKPEALEQLNRKNP